MGGSRVVKTIGPADDRRLRSKFDPNGSLTHGKNFITNTRVIFTSADSNALIDRPP